MAWSAVYDSHATVLSAWTQPEISNNITAFSECLFKPGIQLFYFKTPGTCQLKGKQQLWDFKNCFIISAAIHSHRWRLLYCGFLLRFFLKASCYGEVFWNKTGIKK